MDYWKAIILTEPKVKKSVQTTKQVAKTPRGWFFIDERLKDIQFDLLWNYLNETPLEVKSHKDISKTPHFDYGLIFYHNIPLGKLNHGAPRTFLRDNELNQMHIKNTGKIMFIICGNNANDELPPHILS